MPHERREGSKAAQILYGGQSGGPQKRGPGGSLRMMTRVHHVTKRKDKSGTNQHGMCEGQEA